MKKIGVSFPVDGNAYRACLEINDKLSRISEGMILFGEVGNSSPHITVTMGTLKEDDAIKEVIGNVVKLAETIKAPFQVTFSQIYRETLTGHYVFSDVTLPNFASAWRLTIQEAVAPYFAEPARTSEVPHLTVAHISEHYAEIDECITHMHRIPACHIKAIDIGESGPKGIKSSTIKRVVL